MDFEWMAGSPVPAPVVQAANLFVDSVNGDDNNTKAQVLAGGGSVKWKTIARALWGSTNRGSMNSSEAAAAGDVVSVLGGGTVNTAVQYDQTDLLPANAPGSGRFEPFYQPANAGTAGNYITIQANGYVRLAAPSWNGPVVGTAGMNYIKWYANILTGNGWLITCDGNSITGAHNQAADTDADTKASDKVNTRADTGPIVAQGCTGCWFEGFTVDGGVQINYTDNWPGFRIEGCVDITIRNCTVRSFHNESDTVNGVAIQLYNVTNSLVEHNLIYNCGTGVSQKNNTVVSIDCGNNIIRYNLIHDVYHVYGVSWSTQSPGVPSPTYTKSRFYRNIGYNFETALAPGIGPLGGTDWCYNNTFYNGNNPRANGSVGVSIPTLLNAVPAAMKCWNNIYHTIATGSFCSFMDINATGMVADTIFDSEHNVFYNGPTNFLSTTAGNQSFATYLGNYADQDHAAGASTQSNPLLTDPANGNFHLTGAGSPAHDLGRDVDSGATCDAGAYPTLTDTTTIGLED